MFQKTENIARLVFHTAWEIANREKRLVVDVVPKNDLYAPVHSGSNGLVYQLHCGENAFPPKRTREHFRRIHTPWNLPKNQSKVAENIGRMVADELLSSEDLKEKLNNPENILTIKELVEVKIDYYLNVSFPKNYPITAALVGDKRKTKFKDTVMEEIDESVPAMIDDYLSNIEERFNVEQNR